MAKLTFRRGSRTIRPLAWAEGNLWDGRRVVEVLRSDGATLRRRDDGSYKRAGRTGSAWTPAPGSRPCAASATPRA